VPVLFGVYELIRHCMNSYTVQEISRRKSVRKLSMTVDPAIPAGDTSSKVRSNPTVIFYLSSKKIKQSASIFSSAVLMLYLIFNLEGQINCRGGVLGSSQTLRQHLTM
jgi:hypothetical protein